MGSLGRDSTRVSGLGNARFCSSASMAPATGLLDLHRRDSLSHHHCQPPVVVTSSDLSPALAFLFETSTEDPSLGSIVARRCCRRRQGCCSPMPPLSHAWAGFRELKFWRLRDRWRRRAENREGGQGVEVWGLGIEKMRTPTYASLINFSFFLYLA